MPDKGHQTRNVSPTAWAAEPWDYVTTPWQKWTLLADDAVLRGDTQDAIEMIRFAYWTADAATIEESSLA